jgi:hypothetical protein
MSGAWIRRRPTKAGELRFDVGFRIGGREALVRHGGSFRTGREAVTRLAFF